MIHLNVQMNKSANKYDKSVINMLDEICGSFLQFSPNSVYNMCAIIINMSHFGAWFKHSDLFRWQNRTINKDNIRSNIEMCFSVLKRSLSKLHYVYLNKIFLQS